jgi:hypothetical protein
MDADFRAKRVFTEGNEANEEFSCSARFLTTNGHEIFLPRPVRHSLGDGGMDADFRAKRIFTEGNEANEEFSCSTRFLTTNGHEFFYHGLSAIASATAE